jgi:hypothetical protein
MRANPIRNLREDLDVAHDTAARCSMINLRPSFGNRSRGVDDPATRDAIADLFGALVRR